MQVPARDFFLKTLFLFDGGEDVGMVLSPQAFHNLNPYADIFNHANIHFWEYMQPGYDALGFISCTGTNFLMRAQAFLEVHSPACLCIVLGAASVGAHAQRESGLDVQLHISPQAVQ